MVKEGLWVVRGQDALAPGCSRSGFLRVSGCWCKDSGWRWGLVCEFALLMDKKSLIDGNYVLYNVKQR